MRHSASSRPDIRHRYRPADRHEDVPQGHHAATEVRDGVLGDIVQTGVVVSNSEVRQGTLSVEPLLYRLVFRNGLIALDRSLRKTHVGRALITYEDAIRRSRPSSPRSIATRAWKGASRVRQGGVCAVTGRVDADMTDSPSAQRLGKPRASNRWCIFMSISPSTRPSRCRFDAPELRSTRFEERPHERGAVRA